MEIYEGFASIYDQAMDNIPYLDWCEDICSYLKKQGLEGGRICELGSGTGAMTELLAMRGYEMLGVDISESMLQVALEKKMEKDLDILYVQQDMRELELHTPMDVILSICDSINYMLSEQDLEQVFESVHDNLKEDGYFIFDVKTAYCFRHIIGSQVWAEQNEDTSYIWENYFYEENNTNEYVLTIFQRESDSNLYRRIEEAHYQKVYELELLEALLEKAGMKVVEAYGNRIGQKITDKSERIYVIAKR